MPQITLLVQTVIGGILIGFVFSLTAVGLTLVYGVMDIVNFAHGEFLMLSMYIAFWMYTLFHFDPLVSLPLCVAALFVAGVLTHKLLISRVLNAPMLAQIFVTFGMMVFLRAAAQFLWTPNYRLIQQSAISGRLEIGQYFVGLPQLVAALGALLTTGFVYWFLERTEAGRALQAVSEDREAAALMGIDSDRAFALAWGIAAACVGVAGALLSTYYYIFPEVGSVFVLMAFVAVALGGFGSVPGALVAGVIIGVVEVLGGLWIGASFKYAVVFVLYMVVVLTRPQGLMGKA